MLYSVEWLRRLCSVDDADGRLADALTARGLTVDSIEVTPHGPVFDVDIPANRPDCLGHLGLARELSAAFATPLASRPDEPPSLDRAGWVRVEIDDAELCPRYTAGLVRQIRVGPSPEWVVGRLGACGLRSINNAVDASNLVMLELGQPIHFFDYDLLTSDMEAPAEIRVRRAAASESLTTLDGVKRRLDPKVLVIADGRRPIALAGVIGGAGTEIHAGTRTVLIEAASFRPQSVRSTARRLGVQTDASFRFERGVDAARIPAAQELAVRLLKELAGAEPLPAFVDAYPAPAPGRAVLLRPDRLERLLGFRPERAEAVAALEALGMAPTDGAGGALRVLVPSWRPDLEREADLVEEVARHLGYDRIPSVAPQTIAAHPPVAGPLAADRACDALAHQGFQEALGYAMICVGEDARFVLGDPGRPIALSNPIAEPLSVLRRSILPGLVRAADLNHRRGSPDVRLYEVGRVFLPRGSGELPREPSRLALAWSGAACPPHWSDPPRTVDFFDLVGIVEHIVRAVSVDVRTVRSPGGPSALHPGIAATWHDGSGSAIAWGGALHPDLQSRLDQPLFVAEIELGLLAALPCSPAQHSGVPRLPAVTRDLSLVLESDVSYRRLIQVLEAVEAPARVRFSAIDRYEGRPLRDGQVALTVRFTLQPAERTLTDERTESYRGELIRALEAELDVKIRA
jgi:phenylalanyl-tRNA synthetase beta chain